MPDDSASTPSEQKKVAISPHKEYDFSGDQICVIQTENTTFKIHRYLLTRDSTIFKDMFDLPHQGANPQDDGVIHLPDSTQAFATLCWALYALPTVLTAQYSPDADVGRLIALARIANKYQFTSLEEWCMDILQHQCLANEFLKACPFDDACALLSVSVTCSSEPVQAAVEAGVLMRPDLAQPDVPWKRILPIFDEFGRRRFRGLVYYHLLQAVENSGCEVDEETGDPRPTIALEPMHVNRIRRGHWAIVKSWTYLAQDLARDEQCPDHEKCRRNWKSFILGKCHQTKGGQAIPLTAIIKRLSRAQALLKSNGSFWDRAVDGNEACLALALKELGETHKRMLDNMHVFFFGPPGPSES